MSVSRLFDCSKRLVAAPVVFFALGGVSVIAADEARWFFTPEPTFMKRPGAMEIPGAKETQLAPALWDGSTLDCQAPESAGLKEVKEMSANHAAEFLATLEPEFVRNRKKVILYAKLESDRPLVASTVFAPGFAKRFEDTLGPKLIVAIPNRYTVFVFPALGADASDFAELVRRAWKATPFPASTEAFEVTNEGVRVVGKFPEP